MNVFYLDEDTAKCAEYHCDKHVVKMILETAQLLSSAWHVLCPNVVPSNAYKLTHKNHPCAKWVREASENYEFVHLLGLDLCDEYTYRYGKRHKSQDIIENLTPLPIHIPMKHMTEVPLCMPDEYKVPGDPVASYRKYYKGEKAYMATYKYRDTPEFMLDV